MRYFLRLVLILVTTSIFSYGQPHGDSSSDQEVVTTMRAIRAAAAAVDKEGWDRLVAANCSFVEPSGIISSRAAHEPRPGIDAHPVDTKVELGELAVHAYGDSAVLTYREDLSVTIGGKTSKSATRYTETYKRFGESWQMIFSAETPIPLPVLITLDSKLYDDYVGEYQLAPQLIGTIYREGDRLMLLGTGWKQPYELLPVASDTFVVKGMEQNEISFMRDEKGKVTQQRSKYRGQEQAVAKKVK
jgi:hypothetical protein